MTDTVVITEQDVVSVVDAGIDAVSVSEIETVRPQFNDVLIINQSQYSYTHRQLSPDVVWTINHNLGRYPSIELLSVGTAKFEADITHINTNQAIVTLAIATAGIAQCN
jgi:hypothetical protein